VAAIALALFVLINLAGTLLLTLSTDNASKELSASIVSKLKSRANYDFAILGSSVVAKPISLLERDFCRNKNTSYDRDLFTCLDAELHAHGFHSQTINLAYPGQWISSDYIWIKDWLLRRKVPGVLFIGISPIDFVDPDRKFPVFSLIPMILFDFVRTPSEKLSLTLSVLRAERSFEDALWQAASSCIYVYQSRQVICQRLDDSAQEIQNRVSQNRAYIHVDDPNKPTLIFQGDRKARWGRSIAQARHVYGDMSVEKSQVEFASLEELLRLCRQNDIETIVVNMPLARENTALMPPGSREQFLERLRKTVAYGKTNVIDLSTSSKFSDDDFLDIFHLNERGARKLIGMLMNRYAETHRGQLQQ